MKTKELKEKLSKAKEAEENVSFSSGGHYFVGVEAGQFFFEYSCCDNPDCHNGDY